MLSDGSFGSSIRVWNETPITRRDTDGYINATEMCKANGKKWNDFWRLDTIARYLEALASNAGIPVFGDEGLVQSRKGNGGGTWVHPDVATELARWISPEFSVFVNRWFREAVEAQIQGKTAPTVSVITPTENLNLIERSYDLLERLGTMSDRDRLLLSDLTRNVLVRASGGHLLPSNLEEEELTISDAWMELMGSPLHRSKSSKVGKRIAALYRDEFQENPPCRTQWVDGAPRQVKSYRRGWLLQAIQRLTNQLQES